MSRWIDRSMFKRRSSRDLPSSVRPSGSQTPTHCPEEERFTCHRTGPSVRTITIPTAGKSHLASSVGIDRGTGSPPPCRTASRYSTLKALCGDFLKNRLNYALACRAPPLPSARRLRRAHLRALHPHEPPLASRSRPRGIRPADRAAQGNEGRSPYCLLVHAAQRETGRGRRRDRVSGVIVEILGSASRQLLRRIYAAHTNIKN
jgi:hypothetical protein